MYNPVVSLVSLSLTDALRLYIYKYWMIKTFDKIRNATLTWDCALTRMHSYSTVTWRCLCWRLTAMASCQSLNFRWRKCLFWDYKQTKMTQHIHKIKELLHMALVNIAIGINGIGNFRKLSIKTLKNNIFVIWILDKRHELGFPAEEVYSPTPNGL